MEADCTAAAEQGEYSAAGMEAVVGGPGRDLDARTHGQDWGAAVAEAAEAVR